MLGPLQTVQRAEIRSVLLALQSAAVHVGVDNTNVVRHVGRLIEGLLPRRLFEHKEDGELLVLVRGMLAERVIL